MSHLRYVAMGDSITAGVGATYKHGYVNRYQSFLKEDLGLPVSVRNYAISGITSSFLLRMLSDASIQDSIRSAQVITCSIGSNDLVQSAKLFQKGRGEEVLIKYFVNFELTFIKIHNIIETLKQQSTTPYILRYVDIYNPFPTLGLAIKWVNLYNRVFYRTTDLYTKTAPIYQVFLGHEKQLLASNEHPNNKGHLLIAEALRQTGYRPLSYKFNG